MTNNNHKEISKKMSNNVLRNFTIATLGVVAIGGGILSISSDVQTQAHNLSTSVISAIQNKDLEAYKKTVTSDTENKINNITQDELNEMADKLTKAQELQKSILDSDYGKFKSLANDQMLNRINSQDKFNKLVEQTKQLKTIQDKADQAIIDNNFEAYKSAESDIKTSMEANKPFIEGNKYPGKHLRSPLTEDQVKARFDKLVADYVSTGNLPTNNKIGLGKGMHEKGIKGSFLKI
jgi:hypothetical protein